MFFPLLLCVMVSIVNAQFSPKSCYAQNREPYLHFATKTAYEFVHGTNMKAEKIPDCQPVQMWALIRHGTRYPGVDDIERLKKLNGLRDEIIKNHDTEISGNLCNEDLDNLRTWELKMTIDDASKLSRQGEDDIKFLAQRMKSRYPDLFSAGYRRELYEFRSTDTQRTLASARKFAEGLFGYVDVYIPKPIENDPLIKPYDNCTVWEDTVDKNPEAIEEKKLFEEGSLMKALIANVSSRLGFKRILDYEIIDSMYDACRYEKALNLTSRPPWCAAFSDSELKVLEYKEDLKYYYNDGYGHDINIKLGCPPVKDFMERFRTLTVDNLVMDTYPRGVFYFTHSTTLHMTMARLGLFKDVYSLKHDNYDLQRKRKWQDSVIGSFAANLVLVFFKCTSGEPNRVLFYSSENLIMDMDNCDLGLCSWHVLEDKYEHIANDCSLDFCMRGSSAILWRISSPLLILPIMMYKLFSFI